MKNLTQTLVSIRDGGLMDGFLDDVLTPSERDELEQRREVAQRLMFGESYQSIEKTLGVSSTTIARVAKCVRRDDSGYVQAQGLFS